MKKILGILMFAVICILGLCSCASPSQQAVNRDQAEKIGDVLGRGKEIDVNGKRVCLYSLTTEYITLGNSYFNKSSFTDFTKLIQYNNYFELYRKDVVYTFSNTVAGYIVY